MEIHQPHDLTRIRRFGHRQQQQPLSRQPSVQLRRLLRQQQRTSLSNQKYRDRRLPPSPVFTQQNKGILTGLALTSLLMAFSGLAIAFSQFSSRPPATHQPTSSPSPVDLRAQAEQLFATPDSLGAIAIGVAEGTRTPDGGRTSIWQQHTDPGNFAENRGTFSWQLEATSVADAEQQGLDRVRREAIPRLLQEAEKIGVPLNLKLLVQGADLWNQSPQAGAAFVKNLQRCQQWAAQASAVVLCARVESYVSPSTGEVEAAGFANDPVALRDDQQRRMQAIELTLRQDPRIEARQIN